MPDREIYSLRQVVELTGLSEFTLRGWENRYTAFRPGRTGTGRREYTAKDLQRAILLRELTNRGRKIGDIAHLPVTKLSALLESDDLAHTPADEPPEVVETLRLASLQEWEEIEKLFRTLAQRRAPLSVALDVVVPLLAGLSRIVALGRFSIAQEHLLSSLVKELLHALRARAPVPPAHAARVLIAAPEGDYHELGILLANVLVALHGFRTLYLGPNSPKADICETALQFGATHVLLGATVGRAEDGREALPSFVHFLDTHLPPKTTIWLGGREGASFQAVLSRSHAIFATITEFEAALRALSSP